MWGRTLIVCVLWIAGATSQQQQQQGIIIIMMEFSPIFFLLEIPRRSKEVLSHEESFLRFTLDRYKILSIAKEKPSFEKASR